MENETLNTAVQTPTINSSSATISNGPYPFPNGGVFPAEPTNGLIKESTITGISTFSVTVSINATQTAPPILSVSLDVNNNPYFTIAYDVLDSTPQQLNDWSITASVSNLNVGEQYSIVLEDLNSNTSDTNIGDTTPVKSSPFTSTVQKAGSGGI